MLPLGLSMLWESVDPDDALAQRFGFDDVPDAAEWLTTVLDESWAIAATDCTRLVISGLNVIAWVPSDRGDLVVKWSTASDRFASLATSTRLLRSLAAQGVPVAAPIATPTGQDRIVCDGPAAPLSVTVLPELSGDWLDVSDRAAVFAAGAALAQVHQGLGANDPPATAGVEGLATRIGRWSAHADHGLAPAASRRLAELLAAAPELDDVPQLVHNDVRAANILMRESTVVAVLDFDEVVVDHRVNDLAKASVYLATRFRDWGPTPGAARRALRDGYGSVRPLAPDEASWLEVLVLWQGLMAIPHGGDPAEWIAAL
jgi:Ser/Thr protein kinase RdoA (MazF antagonist)